MGYIDNLAKRHKEYFSKDVIVAHLTKVEADLKFKKGVMQSEMDELRHQKKELEKQIEKLKKEPFRDTTYKNIKNKLKICKAENNLLKRENISLKHSLLSFENK